MKVGDLEHFKNMSFLEHSARGALRFLVITGRHCALSVMQLRAGHSFSGEFESKNGN